MCFTTVNSVLDTESTMLRLEKPGYSLADVVVQHSPAALPAAIPCLAVRLDRRVKRWFKSRMELTDSDLGKA